jgi:lipopolysaccharide biosynthesis glycosyltransferase
LLTSLLSKVLIQTYVGKITREETDAYHLALGRFVSAFSDIEASMQATLWHFAGVSTPTAQAVFSGTRIEGAMQFINRIADAQRWKKSKRNQIQHIFTQLGHLNKLRNEILHYGAWMLAPGAWIVSNKEFAHMIERIRSIQISPETLREATADVENIQARLKALVTGRRLSRAVRQHAWRYKPPERLPAWGATRRYRRMRLRQQRASRR